MHELRRKFMGAVTGHIRDRKLIPQVICTSFQTKKCNLLSELQDDAHYFKCAVYYFIETNH
jgi:hypothetical protein